LLKESRITSKTFDNETVEEFVSRRFGPELYERVANAVLSGIYAGDPDKMQVAAVLKRFVEMEKEHGSIIKGMKKAKGSGKRVISSFKGGTGVLIQALHEFVRENCNSETAVKSIEKSETGYAITSDSGTQFAAKRIILCLPSYVSSELINTFDVSLANKLKRIPYAKVDMTHLAYKKSQIIKPLEGFGFLAPKIENAPLLGAVANSTAFDHRSENDEVMFTIFSRPDLGHSPEKAQEKLEQLLDIKGTACSVSETKWQKAIPQFHLGHSNMIKEIEAFEQKENIVLSGNYRSGVSVGDCVKFQEELVNR